MKLIPVVVLCCVASAHVLGQEMTSSQIEAAIRAGQDGKEGQLVSRCHATPAAIDRFLIGPDLHPDGEHFHVSLTLTAGRIAALAAAAKRLYKPFLAADVPSHLKTLAVYVEAVPHQPAAESAYAVPVIEHVVLKSKKDRVVQPVDFKAARVEWANPSGSKAQPNQAFAQFPAGSVRELPAGEFDVVLVTDAGERKCKVGSRDRERLFQGR